MIEFIGKFHPLFVHLPIGFILLLAALEWLALRPKGKELAPANRIILLLTIPAAIASAVCGWLLAEDGGYDATNLFWHRWLGVGVAVATIILWVLRQHGSMVAYRRSLFGTVLLLTVASHFGGSLTHGNDYLKWPKARAAAPAVSEEKLLAQPVYATTIQPLFDNYCVSCHGADKSKGGLRMDTATHVLAGGDSGSLFEPPGATASLLGTRLSLPMDDEEHMPPDGKPQLSAAQLTLVKWWLEAGAPTEKTLAELQPSTEMVRTILATIPLLEVPVAPRP